MKIHIIRKAGDEFEEMLFGGAAPKALPTLDDLKKLHEKKQRQQRVQQPGSMLKQKMVQRERVRPTAPEVKAPAPSNPMQKVLDSGYLSNWGVTKDPAVVAELAREARIMPLINVETVSVLMADGQAYIIRTSVMSSETAAIMIVSMDKKVKGVWYHSQITISSVRHQIREFVRTQKLDTSEWKCWCSCTDQESCRKGDKIWPVQKKAARKPGADMVNPRSDGKRAVVKPRADVVPPDGDGETKFKPGQQRQQPGQKPTWGTFTEQKPGIPPTVMTPSWELPIGWKQIIDRSQLTGILAKWGMDISLADKIEAGDEVYADQTLGIVAIINTASGELKQVAYPKDKPQDPKTKADPVEKAKSEQRLKQVQKLVAKKKIKKVRNICICNSPSCRIGPFHPVEDKK